MFYSSRNAISECRRIKEEYFTLEVVSLVGFYALPKMLERLIIVLQLQRYLANTRSVFST